MKVAKNNSNVKINTNSKDWKFVIYNPNKLDKAIYKAKTIERANKKASYFDGYIVDELIFESDNNTFKVKNDLSEYGIKWNFEIIDGKLTEQTL